MKLIVDTSILIDYLRGGNRWEEVIKEIGDTGEYYIPTIVVFELFSGHSSKDRQKTKGINEFLTHFKQIPLTHTIAERAGVIFRDITKQLEVPDYLIAATALELNATIVTLNKKHFQQIPLLSIYPI